MTNKTDKFKNKVGAPTKLPEHLRADLRTKVAPATKSWLDSKKKGIGSAYGRSIDELVQKEIEKLDYDSQG